MPLLEDDKPNETESQSQKRKDTTADEALRNALLIGICALVFLAPDFTLKLLGGRIDLALLQQELGDRTSWVRRLFVGTPPGPVQALRHAIVGQESGGDHTLLNASGSGAMGLGQVMPENLPVWSQEAFGREVSEAEFLNNPDLQIRLIDFKLQQYWDEAIQQSGGNQDEAVMRVASRWYSGDPSKFSDTTPQYWDGTPYPSIAEYSQQVLARFKAQRS